MEEKKINFSVGDLIIFGSQVGIITKVRRPGITIRLPDKERTSGHWLLSWTFSAAISSIENGFAKHYPVKSSS